MLIIPAIDLMDGQVVRLEQGHFDRRTVYPVPAESLIDQYRKAGARWIHVVNLDGAAGKETVNRQLIEKLLRLAPGCIEIGGGIRQREEAVYWMDRGAGRIILGSAAVDHPALAGELIKEFGADSIAVSIDCRRGYLAVRGWTETLAVRGIDFAQRMAQSGVERLIVTDIAADGMLSGPNLKWMLEMAGVSGLKIIVSGGVSSMDDLKAIDEVSDQGLEGVIIGKAIYENRIRLTEAIRKYQHQFREGTYAARPGKKGCQ